MRLLRYFLWHILYPIMSPLISNVSRFVGPRKVKNWFHERREETQKNILSISEEKKHLLFLCPSLGEYEAVKMVIKKLKSGQSFIEVSFFSPSGYKGCPSSEPFIDHISYCPIDTPREVDQFISLRNIHSVYISGVMIWPTMMNRFIADGTMYFSSESKFTPISRRSSITC